MQNTNRLRAVLSCGEYEEWEREEGGGESSSNCKMKVATSGQDGGQEAPRLAVACLIK